MNGNKIDELAERVWRAVVASERPKSHACAANASGDPTDCPLYRTIHETITEGAANETKPRSAFNVPDPLDADPERDRFIDHNDDAEEERNGLFLRRDA